MSGGKLDPALADAIVADVVASCAVVVTPGGIQFLGGWKNVAPGMQQTSVCKWAIEMLERKLREIPR